MKENIPRSALAGAASMALILVLLSCAVQKPLWGDLDTGLTLSYRATGDSPIKYQHNASTTQELEMMGYPVKTVSDVDMAFSFVATDRQGDDLSLHITLDHFFLDISNPPQSFSPDTSHLAGKTFTMGLSSQGKESSLSEAESLTYARGPGSTSSLKTFFDASFPDLPTTPITIGGTWPSADNVTSNDSNTKIHLAIDWINLLEGTAVVDSRECVKISSKASGIMEGSGTDPGLGSFTFRGDITGSATWFFAYKEGVLAGSKVEFASNIEIVNPMGNMPVKWATTSKTRRVE